MLAKAHIARKDLGLDEATYRAVVSRISGGHADSAGKLSGRQLDDLLSEFMRLGWKPKTVPKAAGVVRDRSEEALRSYVARMTRRSDLRFCSPVEKGRLIEALKQWADRAGVDLQ
jgi:phage gp16-like protein